jgi:alkylation response protein AidB-like acyl-CoA dehydrogenase
MAGRVVFSARLVEIRFSPAEEAFRAEARAWLEANMPRTPRPADLRARRRLRPRWQRRMHDGGWAGIAWPHAYGGRGATLMEQLIWYEEYARAGAPDISTLFVGLNHAGPTLIACGTRGAEGVPPAAHPPRRRHLVSGVLGAERRLGPGEPADARRHRRRPPRRHRTEDLDQLRAHRRVPGAPRADRPGRAAPPWHHVGHLPDEHAGIEIRPITTLTGGSDFAEVFYDAVRIPLANVVGQLNDGWRVAMATLSFERGTAFLSEQVRIARRVDELVAVARRSGATADHEIARRLARAQAEVDAMRAMSYRSISLAARTGVPGAEASLIRLFFSELVQRIDVLAMDIAGPAAVEDPAARVTESYLAGLSQTIGGGTKDIQRNIIGDRFLGPAALTRWT